MGTRLHTSTSALAQTAFRKQAKRTISWMSRGATVTQETPGECLLSLPLESGPSTQVSLCDYYLSCVSVKKGWHPMCMTLQTRYTDKNTLMPDLKNAVLQHLVKNNSIQEGSTTTCTPQKIRRSKDTHALTNQEHKFFKFQCYQINAQSFSANFTLKMPALWSKMNNPRL